jgi:hypothetical protein
MVKKQLPAHVAQQRLAKVSVKQTIAANKLRSDFVTKVASKKVGTTSTPVSSRAGQLIDRTRAAKSAPFTGQYKRVNER